MQRITQNGKKVIVLSQTDWQGLGRTPQPKNMRFDVGVRAEIWVDPDEIEGHQDYNGIVRSQLTDDEKIAKLKECARQVAQDTLDLLRSNRAVQISGEVTLADINFDRIDWVALATQNVPRPEVGHKAEAQKDLKKEANNAMPLDINNVGQWIKTNAPDASGYIANPAMMSGFVNFMQNIANKGMQGAQAFQAFLKQHNTAVPQAKGVQPPPPPLVDTKKGPGAINPSSGGASGVGSGRY